MKPNRIISLVPSQTELLHWLGLEVETIGITKFCVHPAEWFEQKTRIGGTKSLDIQKITSLQPDLIIANKEENVKDQVEMLAENFPVWVTDVNDLEEATAMIGDIGQLTHTGDKAEYLITSVRNMFDELSQASPVNKYIPAIYLIWREPYMTVGGDTFISHILNVAGFENVYADRIRYPEITLEQIRSSACKVVLLSSEPYPFKQKHIDEMQKELPGIKIILVDGEMFSWYGSRLLLAPEYFLRLREEL